MAAMPGSDKVSGDGNHTLLPRALQEELWRALATIRYGTIELVIHNGRVVQLERREKVRFDQQLSSGES